MDITYKISNYKPIERRTEAIVDAIGYVNDFHNPKSQAYKLRSPLLLQSFALPGKHVIDEAGLRVFPSLVSGYKASVYDAGLKVTGNSRARLKPSDTLVNLLGVYRIKDRQDVSAVIEFLQNALDDLTISENTTLSYFIEESNVHSR